MADENDWVGKENERIAKRRDRLGVKPPEVATEKGREPGAWGLALSGGGIRSATFSLGVLQALAQAELDQGKGRKTAWLRFFDYLSTVSGGGYMGAFFASLFQPRRLEPPPPGAPWWRPMARAVARVLPGMRGKLGLGKGAQAKAAAAPGEKTKDEYCREAAEMAYTVLKDDPPGRVRSREAYDWKRRPLAWLRENGRYLTPTGAGDFLYAAGLAIRNWFSLHYVIGSALVLLFALVALLKSSAALYMNKTFDLFAWHAWAIPDPSAWSLWWSPLWVLPLAVFALWEAPSGIAFWLIASRDGGEAQGRLARTFTLQAWMALAIALVLARLPVTLSKLPTPLAGEGLLQLKTGCWLLAALVLIALVFHAGAALAAENTEGQRVRQTRVLASGLTLMLWLAVLALLDTLSQTFYFWLSHAESVLWRVLTPGALVGALVWAVQKLATGGGGGGKPLLPRWLPLSAVACAGAVALLAAVATVWAMLVQWLLWGLAPSQIVNADVLAAQYPTTLFLVALGLLPVLINGLFPSFINLSTLQAFYSARLTRAYLGASNGARFRGEDGRRYASAAEPHPLDPIAREAYYDEDVLAPLHLINVTMNLTVDPTEQLVQRDRKGLPLAVGPAGYLLDGWYRPHWTGRGDYPIGEWIGVSGAAFTTGLGRATSLGLSLLLGLANVRLGLWWRSKLGADDLRPGLEWLALKVFPTQVYLGYELTARFHGSHRTRQYLSDGGHFENTATYELLRPQREVDVIVACDDGCDPDYQFADIANLIRLARIDHRAHFTLVSDFPGSGLGAIFGRDEDFAQKAGASNDKCALLYRVTYPKGEGRARWLVVLKPRLVAAAPLDVWQYRQAHESFPQETTTDQFFDEAQWESYRRLGVVIGTLVFGGENGAKLVERLKQDP